MRELTVMPIIKKNFIELYFEKLCNIVLDVSMTRELSVFLFCFGCFLKVRLLQCRFLYVNLDLSIFFPKIWLFVIIVIIIISRFFFCFFFLMNELWRFVNYLYHWEPECINFVVSHGGTEPFVSHKTYNGEERWIKTNGLVLEMRKLERA